MKGFKVGTRVVVRRSQYDHYTGRTGTVVGHGGTSIFYVMVRLDNPGYRTFYFLPEQLEAAEEKPNT